MSLTRNDRETQRAFVERILREQGEVHTYDVLFDSYYTDGRKTSVTRLAAIIHTLRSEGWQISTRELSGSVATYVLGQSLLVWRCSVCGTLGNGEPEPLLGGMGNGYCLICKARRTFVRKRAA